MGKATDLIDANLNHNVDVCPDCGKLDGSFACKIRHVQLNTGDAKAAND